MRIRREPSDRVAWRDIQQRIATCRECVDPASPSLAGPLQPGEIPEPPETVEVLFVGVAPTALQGPNRGTHFYSSQSDALRRALFHLLSEPGRGLPLQGLNLEEGNARFHAAGCFFVHAAKVRPLRELAPPPEVIRSCALRHLQQEIVALAPRAVCFLGRKTEPAARALFGRRLGRVIQAVELGAWRGHAVIAPQPLRRGLAGARAVFRSMWRTEKRPRVGNTETGPPESGPFLLVGLTGGIASGKSVVSRQLAELGCRVVDADVLAREVVAPGEPAWRAIREEFGRDVLLPDGQLDRKRLGALVFADPARRRTLEAITHPAINARRQAILDAWAAEGFDGLVVLDIPLLIEVGAAAHVDRVVLVYAERAVQLDRLMGRDGFARAEAERRVASQMPLAEKVRHAHFVIDNSDTPDETAAQVRAVHAALLAEHRARGGVTGSLP
jgi:dephospho-CoA kinase